MPKPRRNRKQADPRKPRRERLADWQIDAVIGTSERVFGSVAFVQQRRPMRMPSRSQRSPFSATVTGKPAVSYVSRAAQFAAIDRRQSAEAAALAERSAVRQAEIARLSAIANSVTESRKSC